MMTSCMIKKVAEMDGLASDSTPNQGRPERAADYILDSDSTIDVSAT